MASSVRRSNKTSAESDQTLLQSIAFQASSGSTKSFFDRSRSTAFNSGSPVGTIQLRSFATPHHFNMPDISVPHFGHNTSQSSKLIGTTAVSFVFPAAFAQAFRLSPKVSSCTEARTYFPPRDFSPFARLALAKTP